MIVGTESPVSEVPETDAPTAQTDATDAPLTEVPETEAQTDATESPEDTGKIADCLRLEMLTIYADNM